MKITRTQIGELARKGLVMSVVAGLALAAVSPAMVMSGCEEKKKKVVAPPPPPPPPAPKAPDPIEVGPVLQSMKPDARVQFPQSAAPYTEDLARAIIALANDFAKGDATGVRKKLAAPDQTTLDALVGSGEWEESVKKIEGVRVVGVSHSSPDATSANFGLAFQEQGSAYVVGFAASKSGDTWVIGGASAPSDSKPRASDFDGVSIGGSVALSHAPSSHDDATDEGAGGGRHINGGDKSAGDQPAADESREDQPEKPKPRRKMTPSGPVTIPGGG